MAKKILMEREGTLVKMESEHVGPRQPTMQRVCVAAKEFKHTPQVAIC
jgi:hypothetical protein